LALGDNSNPEQGTGIIVASRPCLVADIVKSGTIATAGRLILSR